MYKTKINGVSCELREPIIKDLIFIGDKVDTLGKSRVSDIQSALLLFCCLCVKWGNKDSTTIEELEALPLNAFKEGTNAVNHFKSYFDF